MLHSKSAAIIKINISFLVDNILVAIIFILLLLFSVSLYRSTALAQCHVHLVCSNKSIRFYAYFLNLTRVLRVQKRYEEKSY